MSMETRQWLSINTLIGFTATRGQAWHWRAGDGNSFAGPVPVERVERLFDWTADPQTIYVLDPTAPMGFREVPNVAAWTRSDTGTVLGIFSERYQGHQFSEWLLTKIGHLLHGEVGIGSAGLLREGRQAWVQVEIPDCFDAPDGGKYRSSILAASSFDGSIATTYKRVITRVVCDNTLAAGLRERSPQFKVKSTTGSLTKINDVRQALDLIESNADAFSQEIAALLAVPVTMPQWTRIRDDVLAPIDPDAKTTRARTLAEKKRSDLDRLYRWDERVAPWAGTAWGVLQADNTYRQHEQTVRNTTRAERNMINSIEGKTAREDSELVARVMELVA